MSKKKFALRSIENVIDTVGKKAKIELPVDSTRAATTLNNFGSTIDRVSEPESDSDSMYQFNEIHRMFEDTGADIERPKPALLKQKSSTISSASSILSGPRGSRSKKVVRIVDSESDDKENIKEKDNVAYSSFSSAPSGSSIRITRRQDNNVVPKPQVKRKVGETRSQKTAENVKQQSVQSPKEKSKPKISRGLGNIVKSMNVDENKKDFDYFLLKTVHETSSLGSTATKVTKATTETTTASLAAASIHSSDDEKPTKATTPTQTGRVKRKSALKASEMFQNIDSEEDEGIRKKYDRRSKEKPVVLFESDDLEDNDEEEDRRRPKKRTRSNASNTSTSQHNSSKSSTTASARKKPLLLVNKSSSKTNKSLSVSKSKSKQQRHSVYDEADDDREIKEAAREYNEIKNYKLIVENVDHDF